MKVKVNKMEIVLDEISLGVYIQYEGTIWKTYKEYKPTIRCTGNINILFSEAIKIQHEYCENGVGKGICSKFEGFIVNGLQKNFSFQTLIWVEKISKNVYFEWIPIIEDLDGIEEVIWPVPFEFNAKRSDWYTIINLQQGMIIPNDWPQEFGEMIIKGYWGTEVGYMPWFSQIKEKNGYIAICEDYWDAGYYVEHPSNGPYTIIGNKWYPSMGKITYKRSIKFIFKNECDYNTICKIFREYAKEIGIFRTLKEKEIDLPIIKKLVGASVVHISIKRNIQEGTRFYNSMDLEQNKSCTTFRSRLEQIEKYHEEGAERLYVHLDGWAEPGYDNQHPDYYLPASEAGSWDGMKEFVERIHSYGDLVGLHDQYKDYYYKAPSFDEEYVCLKPDGSFTSHALWAGGLQAYLCTTQASYYVRRNYSIIKKHDINIDCAYLDAFVCNAADECVNPRHKMSRKECFEYRSRCFRYLMSKGIIPSSEEAASWAVPDLVLTHFAPYEFMLDEPEKERRGIAVPLFELVFHECLISPWMMDKDSDNEDYMLYALLNGGIPYLVREGAYPEIDGAFKRENIPLRESIKRCKVVNELHKRVVYSEMIKHEFINNNYNKQKTTFSDGTVVTVDFKNKKYDIDIIDDEKN